MQSDYEVTISLSDLSSLPQLPSPVAINPFATYLVDLRKKEEKIQLISKDTSELPLKPMRRQACPLCLAKSVPCQKCPQCHPKKKSCCRNLSCIYDYQAYTQNKKEQAYRTCLCIIKDFLPSSDAFQLDWRLLSLIKKLPETKSVTHKYYLHHAGGSLWISKEPPGAFQGGPRQTFHEDNFALASFHQRTFRDQNGSSLAETNSRYFSNLLRKNIRRFLSTKQAWEVSNLQEECQQIADSFFSHKKLEAIKGNMQNTSQNLFAGGNSLKFQGKYTQILVSSSNNAPEYKDCSDLQNPDVSFSYSFRNQFLFIRNAKYLQRQQQSSNLRPIRIRWRGDPIGHQGVWFKDRKGDIFAISKGSLFIFKFHIPSKTFQSFLLDNHPLLGTVDSPSTLLYIPHRDTVYYFTPKDLKKSFYFTLYRPKIQEGGKGKNAPLSKHSCTSVSFYPEFLQEKEKLLPKGGVGSCRAIYAMEDYRFKGGKDQRKELVPVIYLLCERKGYLPLGIGLYRLVHHDDSLQAFNQLPAASPQSNPQDSTRNLSFTSGVNFSLRMEKGLRLCYYSVLDSKPTLITGKVLAGNDGKDGVVWGEDFLELTGCFQPRTLPEGVREAWKPEGYMPFTQLSDLKDQKGHSMVPIFVSDILGAPGNNEVKFMGENYKTGRVVEILISLVEGTPQWRIFEL